MLNSVKPQQKREPNIDSTMLEYSINLNEVELFEKLLPKIALIKQMLIFIMEIFPEF